MVETLARDDHGRRTTVAACATFAAGALAGGVVTFGALSLAGGALHAGLGSGALAVAAAVAAVAAYAEARGLRVLPQIRRQVPEPWRRTMPLPLAAALYGVLLGLGFTTFVLTVATWALAGMSLALGHAATGLAMGLAFGAGRALPVVLIAPRLRTPLGGRLMAAMAERPRLLQALRLGDALGLAACAVALAATPALAAAPAVASSRAKATVSTGTDPSAAAGALAWERPGSGGFIRQNGVTTALPGGDPALSRDYLAYRNGDTVTVVRRAGGGLVLRTTLAGADKLAVSAGWLAVRVRSSGSDRILARRLDPGATPRTIATVRDPRQLGRPALDRDHLTFVSSGRSGSRIVRVDLAHGRARTLRRSHSAQYLSVAAGGGRVLYVVSYGCGQALHRMGTSGRRDHIVLRGRGPIGTYGCGRSGTPTGLWTVALDGKRAYLTRLSFARDGSSDPAIVSVGL